jgi:uncharacterized protein with FMN-binding domain/succinate dehydrogenase/fumarate reductase flavoprotein subunit
MSENEKRENLKKLISRRDFLAASGAVIAAGALASCTPKTTTETLTSTVTNTKTISSTLTQTAPGTTATVTGAATTKTVTNTATSTATTTATTTATATKTVTATPTTPTPTGASGTYTATARGFGGDVTTTVILTNGIITSVKADGPSETPEKGGVALVKVPAAIVAANSTKVDAVAGATITSNAIKNGVDSILVKAGVTKAPASVKMKPGTYVGTGQGFDWIEPIQVAVTVNETKMLSIQVIEKGLNREEPLIMKAAEDLLIPRMIDKQSVTIDSITGATSSSSGIKLAAKDALIKALKAGGSDDSAIKNFYVDSQKTTKTVTLGYKVVVTSMGGAGCAAAMSAAETMKAAGMPVSVLAIEIAGKYGGTAANCGEPFGCNPPRYKTAYNSGKDYCDYASLYNDWTTNYAHGACKTDLVKLMMDESGKTIDWLHFDHGFLFTNGMAGFAPNTWVDKFQYLYVTNKATGCGVPADAVLVDRSTSVGKYFDHIVKDFTDAGGRYMLETECYGLIYDASKNKVTGVKARGYDGTEYVINADVVIMAGGGFGGSAEMEKKYIGNKYYPLNGAYKLWGMAQNKGAMIQAAIGIGAATYNIEMVPIIHFSGTADIINNYPVYYRDGVNERTQEQLTWSLNDIPYQLGSSAASMQVGRNGKRFYNESAGMNDFWKAGPNYFTIYGTDQLDTLAQKGLTGNAGTFKGSTYVFGFGGYPNAVPIPQVYEVMDAAVQKGFVYKADTLEALAAQIGVPAADFTAEVKKYLGFCSAGKDTDFGKAATNLVSNINKAPFYAIKYCPTPYATCAALDVNTNINVLKADGTPIAGLYACGNDSGGVLYAPDKPYASYGGCALGWAYTSGRLAGKNAVTYLKTL